MNATEFYTLALFDRFQNMTPFLWCALVFAVVMLIWNTLEVGRNDAANLVNAVFGSRVMSREKAVYMAGIGVVLGACFSSDVIDTVRKGIFDPNSLDGNYDDAFVRAVSIYISVYIVNTILLYTYSSFGMPVSTTASMVFATLGAAFAMAPTGVVQWNVAGKIVYEIILSIALAGVMGFFIQRAVRGAIRDKWASLSTLLMHGGWIGGGMMAGLAYFMVIKGMKHTTMIEQLEAGFIKSYGVGYLLAGVWVGFAILIHFLLVIFRKRAAELLFPVLAVIGMIAMAFAFGQNDLANCASPGLAVIKLAEVGNVEDATKATLPQWALFGCGVLLVLGMTTKGATRVTQAEVRMGSQGDHVKLYAPQWCIALASLIIRRNQEHPKHSLAPAFTKTPAGKTMHYDPLRACIIVAVSAAVIAGASAREMPVSTTYVAFAAVVATGMADRIFVRGDSALKMGRAIWVVFSWFAAAIVATVSASLICLMVFYTGIFGIVAGLAIGQIIRFVVNRRADKQEERVRMEAEERMHPEYFSSEDE